MRTLALQCDFTLCRPQKTTPKKCSIVLAWSISFEIFYFASHLSTESGIKHAIGIGRKENLHTQLKQNRKYSQKVIVVVSSLLQCWCLLLCFHSCHKRHIFIYPRLCVPCLVGLPPYQPCCCIAWWVQVSFLCALQMLKSDWCPPKKCGRPHSV